MQMRQKLISQIPDQGKCSFLQVRDFRQHVLLFSMNFKSNQDFEHNFEQPLPANKDYRCQPHSCSSCRNRGRVSKSVRPTDSGQIM